MHRSTCRLPILLIRFERNINFLTDFQKNTQISNIMKIHPLGAEIFHADGRMDRQT